MADGQTRGDYYRGSAGGNAGGYSRKRRFREDDDYDRPRYRQREYKEPLSHRVRRQITTIAENPLRDAKVDTIDLAKLITDNHEDEYFCKQLSDFLPQL